MVRAWYQTAAWTPTNRAANSNGSSTTSCSVAEPRSSLPARFITFRSWLEFADLAADVGGDGGDGDRDDAEDCGSPGDRFDGDRAALVALRFGRPVVQPQHEQVNGGDEVKHVETFLM